MRVPDWDNRLCRYLDAHIDAPHQWGVHDCVLFAAGAVEAVTGHDPVADYRGQYAGQDEALAMLEEDFEGSLLVLGDARFGTPVARLQAMRGDVAVGPWAADGHLVMGVVTAQGVAEPGVDGLVFHPLRDAVRCWHG